MRRTRRAASSWRSPRANAGTHIDDAVAACCFSCWWWRPAPGGGAASATSSSRGCSESQMRPSIAPPRRGRPAPGCNPMESRRPSRQTVRLQRPTVPPRRSRRRGATRRQRPSRPRRVLSTRHGCGPRRTERSRAPRRPSASGLAGAGVPGAARRCHRPRRSSRRSSAQGHPRGRATCRRHSSMTAWGRPLVSSVGRPHRLGD